MDLLHCGVCLSHSGVCFPHSGLTLSHPLRSGTKPKYASFYSPVMGFLATVVFSTMALHSGLAITFRDYVARSDNNVQHFSGHGQHYCHLWPDGSGPQCQTLKKISVSSWAPVETKLIASWMVIRHVDFWLVPVSCECLQIPTLFLVLSVRTCQPWCYHTNYIACSILACSGGMPLIAYRAHTPFPLWYISPGSGE